MKKEVIRRAKQILVDLEARDGGNNVRGTAKVKAAPKQSLEYADQLSFMQLEENEVVAEIKALDLDSMSPMEALTKLYALKAKAKSLD